ncbi:MAG: hypothetical protein ACRDSR_10690 [Pseudonocardiaceae bacterium]
MPRGPGKRLSPHRHDRPGEIGAAGVPPGLNTASQVAIGEQRQLCSAPMGSPGGPSHQHISQRLRGCAPRMIFQALGKCEPPAGSDQLTAVEVFAGYLVLDAWVADQDRHDQNWAVLRQAAAPGELRLASSYDHASSLGFNLLDTRREKLLASEAVATGAARGTAHRFEHDPDAHDAGRPRRWRHRNQRDRSG